MPDQPDTATDISPAEGDALTDALERARAAARAPSDNSEIAADDMGATAAAEQMNKPKPPPLG